MLDDATIVAIATPPGAGGVGIVRLSGANALAIAKKLVGSKELLPRIATFSPFFDETGACIDRGIALYFKAPHSFTGEDVVECHLHGSPIVLQSCVEAAIHWGARQAGPGEFSLRAFLNGKVDLAQAEAIKDLIHATSKQAAKSAVRSLEGVFSKQVGALLSEVTYCRVYIEASIDFSDEDITLLEEDGITARVFKIEARCRELLAGAQYGVVLKDGYKVGLAGEPNAGKSSLLNALAREEVAIVTDIPGTTRDVLTQTVRIGDLTLELVDTAGLRESADVIETIGIERARKVFNEVDLLLYLVDAQKSFSAIEAEVAAFKLAHPNVPVLVVLNKTDLLGLSCEKIRPENPAWVRCSTVTSEGLVGVLDGIKSHWATMTGAGQGQFTARLRHVQALERALVASEEASSLLQGRLRIELVAHCLKEVQTALSEITGEFRADDLLGKIFSEFCIGK